MSLGPVEPPALRSRLGAVAVTVRALLAASLGSRRSPQRHVLLGDLRSCASAHAPERTPCETCAPLSLLTDPSVLFCRSSTLSCPPSHSCASKHAPDRTLGDLLRAFAPSHPNAFLFSSLHCLLGQTGDLSLLSTVHPCSLLLF